MRDAGLSSLCAFLAMILGPVRLSITVLPSWTDAAAHVTTPAFARSCPAGLAFSDIRVESTRWEAGKPPLASNYNWPAAATQSRLASAMHADAEWSMSCCLYCRKWDNIFARSVSLRRVVQVRILVGQQLLKGEDAEAIFWLGAASSTVNF